MNDKVFNFDLNEVEDEKGFSLLVAGEYTAMITKAEMTESKSGGADYLKVEYTCEDEAGQGGKVWENLCINHGDGTTAQNIARSRLKSICVACDLGLSAVSNPEQILDRTVKVLVGIRKDKTGQYSDQNTIKKVMPLVEETEAETTREEMPDFSKSV